MSIPFFSIDFKYNDWKNYIHGSLGIKYKNNFESELVARFGNNNITTFPSSRVSFIY